MDFQITPKQVQSIIFGSFEFADKCGFKPHRDFERAKSYVGIPGTLIPIKFGYKGEPIYISGPYDIRIEFSTLCAKMSD